MSFYPKPAPPPSLSITPSVHVSATFDFVAIIVFEAFAIIFFGLRILVRIKQGGKFYANDWAIFWAMFWGTFLAINSIVSVCYGGVGHHMDEILALTPERVPSMLKTFLIGQFGWALANAGVKVSLLDLYIKIFGTVNRHFRLVSYVLMALTVMYCIMVMLVAFLTCTPFESNWNPAVKGDCGDQKAAYLAEGIINLVLDIGIIALPIPRLWKLQMPMHKRVGLTVMLSGGVIICGITIWRIVLLNILDASDPFYAVGYLSATTNIEPLLGIALACLPITRPLITSFKQSASHLGSKIYGQKSTITESKMPHSAGDKSLGSSSYFNGSAIKSGNERKNFTRLYDDGYPLNDMRLSAGEGDDGRMSRSEQGTHGIVVEQTWDVARSRAEV